MQAHAPLRPAALLLALALGCGVRGTPSGLTVAPAPAVEAVPASVARTLVTGAAPLALAAGPARRLVLANASGTDATVALTATAARRVQAARRAPRLFEGPPPREADPPSGGAVRALAAAHAGDLRGFWVSRIVTGDEVRVATHAVMAGAHTEVWVDDALGASADAAAALIGRAFEATVYPTDVRLFGAPVAPPGASTRVALVISAVVDGGGADATAGYTYTRDLGAAVAGTPTAHSNEGLVMYLAPGFLADQQADMLATTAHELEHVINASNKLLGGRTAVRSEASWLDEALAMYAMQANGYGLGGPAALVGEHVDAFLADPGSYSLTDWERNPERSGYGMGYLFMAYLAGRFGPALVTELARSRDRGSANLEARLAARGSSLAIAFRDWAIATGRPTSPDARFRYTGVSVAPCQAEALAGPAAQGLALLPWGMRCLDVSAGSLGLQAAPGVAAALLAP